MGKPGTGSSPSSRELPPPKALPQPQPAGFVVVSAELPPLAELSCAPGQALQPSPASFCWSQADVLTCEQLLLKNRYPPFQRAKSLGQLGKTGKGHRLNLFFALRSLWCFTRRSRWLEMGLGGPSWCLCMLETISVRKPDKHCLFRYL